MFGIYLMQFSFVSMLYIIVALWYGGTSFVVSIMFGAQKQPFLLTHYTYCASAANLIILKSNSSFRSVAHSARVIGVLPIASSNPDAILCGVRSATLPYPATAVQRQSIAIFLALCHSLFDYRPPSLLFFAATADGLVFSVIAFLSL